MNKKLRAIAIHLPQFHTIPENDKWWGKGFTEWTNVRKARPLFDGHYQPHVPLNNNYYDLSENEVLCKQADLAHQYGIDGFCFYHYWFNGKKLLEKPLEQMLERRKPDFPFMLCWANENWTRTWDGKENDVLMQQEYSLEDDEAHFDYLLPFFRDQRYITIDGKPVILIYRSELFPDIKKTIEIWRKKARTSGLVGLYLIRVESFLRNINPVDLGFDAAMDFQPNWENLPKRLKGNFFDRIFRRLTSSQTDSVFVKNRIFSFNDHVSNQNRIRDKKAYKIYPSIVPCWDNSARRATGATIFKGSTPKFYGDWLENTIQEFKPYSKEENLIFINAWNEWGEGNHLEPCEKWGYSYLEETKKALNSKHF